MKSGKWEIIGVFHRSKIALAALLLSHLAWSAESYSGRVTDAQTGEPLPFTNIGVLGTSFGTISNADGYFVLDLSPLKETDVVVFSYVGYETLKMSIGELPSQQVISLRPATLELSSVQVLSRELTAEEIVARVRKHYPENHPQRSMRQQAFFHYYEKAPFAESNQINIKDSDFVGLDKTTFQELFQKLPRTFVEYQDALVDWYSHGPAYKFVPEKAISLEESAMRDLGKEMEKQLSAFFMDIQSSAANPDLYYQFRSGIFSVKAGNAQTDSTFSEQADSLHLLVPLPIFRANMLSLISDYSSIESKNWEFITHPGKYTYTKDELTVYGDELVYPIHFSPKKAGLFEGTLYVSSNTYGILQLDFAFAPGKSDENIQILGVGHSMRYKKGRVIFEKLADAYFVKYIYAEQHEKASINRSFSVSKKEKRFLLDKKLNTVQLEAQLQFDMQSYRELLILNREPVTPTQFAGIAEPKVVRFQKEVSYTPEMWNDRTVLTPTSELQTYQRQQ